MARRNCSARFLRSLAGAAGLVLVMVPTAEARVPAEAPGLDPSFGSGGVVLTPIGSLSEVGGIVRGPGDRLIVAASTLAGTSNVVLLRYFPSGRHDPSFGSGGQVFAQLGSALLAPPVMAQQPDGKLLVARADEVGTSDDDYRFEIARFDADGTVDMSFGAAGRVTGSFGGLTSLAGLGVQPSGDILVAGTRNHVRRPDVPSRVVVRRYSAVGDPDMRFGDSGLVEASFGVGGRAVVRALLVQPDGRFVVGGATPDSPASFALERFAADGQPDASFGAAGIVRRKIGLAGGARVMALARAPRSGLVAAGAAKGAGGNDKVLAARILSDGSGDARFGGDGVVTVGAGVNAEGRAVVALRNGGLSAAGFASFPVPGSGLTNEAMLIVRFAPNGQLDRAMGLRGRLRTHLGLVGNAGANALVEEGRFGRVAAGYASGLTRRIALARTATP
jgi:uncharacterized delta-60 repeat protein